MDDPDVEILSELDDNEVILFKTDANIKQQEKCLKLDIESRHYAYDMESMLVSTPQPNGSTKDVHEVVLVVARQLYTDFNDENPYHVFNDIGSFLKFSMSKKRSYFWAHNAQGNDSRLLFSYVSHVSTLYKPTMRGEKILQFCIKTTKFRDSMCHLAGSLDSLPKMLGFSGDWKKGFFPHKFNVPNNQKYVGHLPDRNFYELEEMKEKRKQEFEKWYIQEQLNYQDSTWDFQQNLHVMVLSKALEIYDSLMKELNDGISPLTNITLASYALTVFRNLYMPKDTHCRNGRRTKITCLSPTTYTNQLNIPYFNHF